MAWRLLNHWVINLISISITISIILCGIMLLLLLLRHLKHVLFNNRVHPDNTSMILIEQLIWIDIHLQLGEAFEGTPESGVLHEGSRIEIYCVLALDLSLTDLPKEVETCRTIWHAL